MPRLIESVEIRAPVEKVFCLLVDIRKRLELNSGWKVVGVEQITMGEPGEGAKFRVKLQVGQNIVEYITQWRKYVKNRRIVSKTLTGHEAKVALSVEEIPGGTRLTHEEVFELPALQEEKSSENASLGRKMLDSLIKFELMSYRTAGFLHFENIRSQESEITEMLRGNLKAWLKNIKSYLEAQTWTLPETSLH